MIYDLIIWLMLVSLVAQSAYRPWQVNLLIKIKLLLKKYILKKDKKEQKNNITQFMIEFWTCLFGENNNKNLNYQIMNE